MPGVLPVTAADREAIDKILGIFRGGRRFLASAHARSDPDALGTGLVLVRLLRKMGKEAHMVVDGGTLPEFRFLPGSDEVGAGPDDLRPPYDAMTVTDSGNIDRLERIQAAVTPGLPIINIDHHATNTRFGTVNWIDLGAAAVGEIVYKLVVESGVGLDREMAVNLYTSLYTDTGRFSFSNVTPNTHRLAAELLTYGVEPAVISKELYRSNSLTDIRLMAACMNAMKLDPKGRLGWIRLTDRMMNEAGTHPQETEDYVHMVKSIKGIEVAVLLRELHEPERIKVSWRSEAVVDVCAIAKRFGGGGHVRAAGCSIHDKSIADAEDAVLAATREAMAKHGL